MKSILLVPILFALGEIEVPLIQQVSQLGALGVLAYFCFSQQKELQRLRQDHTQVISELCNRWDGWERIRHSDSEKLDETLRVVVANCAAAQKLLSQKE